MMAADDTPETPADADTPAEETPLFQEIRRRGATREPPLIVETLRALAEGRADPSGEHPPLDLTAHVEVALSNSR